MSLQEELESHSHEVKMMEKFDTYIRARVIDIGTDKDTANEFGSVSGGFVKLETIVVEGWVLRTTFGRYSFGRDGQEQALIFKNTSGNRIIQGRACMDDDDLRGQHVSCAFLAQVDEGMIFLLLQPAQNDADSYIRVGIADIRSPWAGPDELGSARKLLKSTTRRTIVIK